MKKLPSVVIVGRANVGKSSLFNRLSSRIKTITYDEPGVTRDFVTDQVDWKQTSFNLVDTGGIDPRASLDPLSKEVAAIAKQCIEQAQVLVFVIDGTTGVLNQDRTVAHLLLKTGKPVIVVVNKIDAAQAQEHMHEAYSLGFDTVVGVSAQHGTGSGDLLDAIIVKLGTVPTGVVEQEKPRCKVVLLGKPNVGKSSLLNQLVQKERALVADMPGTTREAITETISFYHEPIEVTDTPGLRRKRGITEPLENLMVKSALEAVNRADIVLLMLDGSSGQLADQELKLAFYILEKHKGLILLINKNDLMDDTSQADLKFSMSAYKHLFQKVPVLYISCKTGDNVGKIVPLITKVWERSNQEFESIELTHLFKKALEKTPLYYQSKPLMLYKAIQVHKAPLTIRMVVNEPLWFGESQRAFFENVLRRKYELLGAAVAFAFKKKGQD
jgi:GTP-binding protein